MRKLFRWQISSSSTNPRMMPSSRRWGRTSTIYRGSSRLTPGHRISRASRTSRRTSRMRAQGKGIIPCLPRIIEQLKIRKFLHLGLMLLKWKIWGLPITLRMKHLQSSRVRYAWNLKRQWRSLGSNHQTIFRQNTSASTDREKIWKKRWSMQTQ